MNIILAVWFPKKQDTNKKNKSFWICYSRQLQGILDAAEASNTETVC